MSFRMALIILAGAALGSNAALAGQPQNPGGFGQAIKDSTQTARGAGPGSSAFGDFRADVAQGEFSSLGIPNNPTLNAVSKVVQGAVPTPGAP